MASGPCFMEAIQVSLAEWSALQLAIDQGMGGQQGKEKEQWMAEVIRDFFVDNRGGVDRGELTEYIAEIVDNEFDTVIEDGSLEHLVKLLCYYLSLITQGKEAEVIDVVKAKAQENDRKTQEKTKENNDMTTEMMKLACNESDASAADQNNSNAVVSTDESNGQAPIDDEWTVVTKKKSNSSRK